MKKNTRNLILILLSAVLFFSFLFTSLNAGTKKIESSPLFYVKAASLSTLSSNLIMIDDLLSSKLKNYPLKQTLKKWLDFLNIPKLMLNGIDTKAPFYIYVNLKKMDFGSFIQNPLNSINFFTQLDIAVEITLNNNEMAESYLSKVFKTKFVDGVLHKEKLYVILEENTVLISTTNNTAFPKENRMHLDSLVKDKVVYEDKIKHLCYYKVNFSAMEKFFRSDILKYFLKALKNEKNDYYTKAGALNIFKYSYLWELYSKLTLQSYKLSPKPLQGWLDVVIGDDSISFEGKSYGSLYDRIFLKNFLDSYKKTYSKEVLTGHVFPGFTKPYAHLTVPLRLKDFINTLDKLDYTDTFLIRDSFSLLTTLTDLLFIEDSKNGFWKQLDSSMDLIIYDIPDFAHRKEISAYKYLLIAGLKNENTFLNFLERNTKRWLILNEAQKKKKTSLNLQSLSDHIQWVKEQEGLYRITIQNQHIFIGAGNGSVFIVRDKTIALKLLTGKKITAFLRPSLSFSAAKKKNTFTALPLAFQIDFNKIRKKLFPGNYQILSKSSLFMPSLRRFEMRQDMQENGDSHFNFEIDFN